MNFFLLYLADISYKLSFISIIFIILTICLIFLTYIVIYLKDENEDTYKIALGRMYKFLFILILINILLPSRLTLYLVSISNFIEGLFK